MRSINTLKFATIAALLVSALFSSAASAQNQSNNNTKLLDINRVYQSAVSARNKERSANSARESQFKSELGKQRGRHNSMKNERIRQERISVDLENQYDNNEKKIQVLQEELAKELGDLKQLFGVIQLSASEAQDIYKTSFISAQYPDRAENLRVMVEKMASLTELVSINEIEDLWYQLQNEMTEQGKIVQYSAPVRIPVGEVVDEEGNVVQQYEEETRNVTRVGVFSAVSDGDILTYSNEDGFTALERQMRGTRASFVSKSMDLQSATSGVTSFMLDPTKGALSAAYVREPSLIEKIQEGGIVGYVILSLGAIAFVLALIRIFGLIGVEAKVKKQAKDVKRPSTQNPLGRVIKVFQDNTASDPESLELKLGEAMLKESPGLNWGIMFIKIIAVVAPLLGLLGTVTGMIQTFQVITLFGAGDPQMMAGGISQALVTTILGLVVAIPTVFLHWMASSRAKRIEETLEEHASGLIAERYENN